MTTNIFGQIVTAPDVEDAMVTTLQAWAPDYIAEVGRKAKPTPLVLPAVRGWNVVPHANDKWLEDQTPLVLVASPGLKEPPAMRGDGSYTTGWEVGVGVVASARDQATTERLCKLYVAALRTVVVQHKSLGGFASDTVWVAPGERYDDLPTEQTRTMMIGSLHFTVYVEDTVNGRHGPQQPSSNPQTDPGPWPTAQRTYLTVDPEGTP